MNARPAGLCYLFRIDMAEMKRSAVGCPDPLPALRCEQDGKAVLCAVRADGLVLGNKTWRWAALKRVDVVGTRLVLVPWEGTETVAELDPRMAEVWSAGLARAYLGKPVIKGYTGQVAEGRHGPALHQASMTRHGQGVQVWAGRCRYEGQFSEHLPDGAGELFGPDDQLVSKQ